MLAPSQTIPAPESLIDSSGRPVFGQFNGIPKQLGIEKFNYRDSMDRGANLWGRYFDYKQFQFISVVTSRFIIGVAIADIRYLGSSFCYVYDIQQNKLVEQTWLRPLSIDKVMSSSPHHGLSHIAGRSVMFNIDAGVWQISIDTKTITANITLSPPEGSLPLSMCTPTGYSGWTYTQKHNALSVSGWLIINGRPVKLDNALAGYDFSAGYMRRETSWRWASIHHQLNGKTLGLNLAAGVNETGSCENALWINGERHLLGPVFFNFDRANQQVPWHIHSLDGRIELTFQAKNQRSEKLNLWLLKSNFRQFIGFFNGIIIDNHGVTHHLNNVIGLTEDHFARW